MIPHQEPITADYNCIIFIFFRGIPLERGVCSGGLHREKVSKDKLLDFCSGIEKETKRFRLAKTVQFSLLCFFFWCMRNLFSSTRAPK